MDIKYVVKMDIYIYVSRVHGVVFVHTCIFQTFDEELKYTHSHIQRSIENQS